MNTVLCRQPANFEAGEEARNEFDRRAGKKTAYEKGLVTGFFGRQTPTTRLEHKPGFACKLGIATAQGAGLRNALSGSRPRRALGGFVSEAFAAEQNWLPISVWRKAGDFPNQSRTITAFCRFMRLPPSTSKRVQGGF